MNKGKFSQDLEGLTDFDASEDKGRRQYEVQNMDHYSISTLGTKSWF